MKYDKLVRDRIPEILFTQGLKYRVHIVDNEDLKCYLGEKLTEEVNEFLENPCIEELGDIQEVIYGILEAYKWGKPGLDNEVAMKRDARGAFSKGIILKEVITR